MEIRPHGTSSTSTAIHYCQDKSRTEQRIHIAICPLRSSDDEFQYKSCRWWSSYCLDHAATTYNCFAIIVPTCGALLPERMSGMTWVLCWHYSTHTMHLRLKGQYNHCSKKTHWPTPKPPLRHSSVGKECPGMRHGARVSLEIGSRQSGNNNLGAHVS